MTENKGDLISREALKEAFDDYIKANPNISGIFEVGKFIIDNAPTVKSFTLEDIEEQYRKGLEKGLSEWETERPQGEWVWSDNRWGLGDWLCNKCEHYAHDKSNFCPNCGAEMVGGES